MKELLTTSIFCLEADIGLTLRQKASRIRQKDLEHNRKAAEKNDNQFEKLYSCQVKKLEV